MRVSGPSFRGTGKKAFLIAALLVVIPAFAQSTLTLIADRLSVEAESFLDDPGTEEMDMIDLSEQSMPTYTNAIRSLEQARTLVPLNSSQARTLAELYFRVNTWQETMRSMGASVSAEIPPGNQFHDAARRNAKKAITLDPVNADHYLVLAQMYAADGMQEAALEQLMKSVKSYPINGSIRYAAAMQMLTLGLNEQAREQARILAHIDDSYRVEESDPRTVIARERRMPWYEAHLSSSYLLKAFEIIWRTSERDRAAVEQAMPLNADAEEVLRLFWEEKAKHD